MTADELLQLPSDGWRYELVEGELQKMSPTGERHGYIAAGITASLYTFVRARKLGRVYTADAGYRLSANPDTVRAPDVSFVSSERAEESMRYMQGPPDLAVEVVSPNDTYSEIEKRIAEFLRAGASAVVIVDPSTKTARIHRSSGVTAVAETIDLPDILPGWSLSLSELFD